MMKLLVVVVISLSLLKTLVAREISRETLDEIESIIHTLKESAGVEKRKPAKTVPNVDTDNLTQTASAKHGLKIVGKEAAKLCGKHVRINYQECLSLVRKRDQQRNCAVTFIKNYITCFFGNSLESGHPDIMVCDGSCIWNFDQCLINSSKVEMFTCMSGRDKCREHCPWPVTKKRNVQTCHNNCEGKFDQCLDVTQNTFEAWICSANRNNCRTDFCG